jgi:hypothetical protein
VTDVYKVHPQHKIQQRAHQANCKLANTFSIGLSTSLSQTDWKPGGNTTMASIFGSIWGTPRGSKHQAEEPSSQDTLSQKAALSSPIATSLGKKDDKRNSGKKLVSICFQHF